MNTDVHIILDGLSVTLSPLANWVAQDADGEWWGYHQKPTRLRKFWWPNAPESLRMIYLGQGKKRDDWHKQLYKIARNP